MSVIQNTQTFADMVSSNSASFDHEELLLCKCGDPSHCAMIRYVNTDKDVELIVFLARPGFWRRILHACKYIFGSRSIYGDFDTILLRPQDAMKLQKVVDHLNK